MAVERQAPGETFAPPILGKEKLEKKASSMRYGDWLTNFRFWILDFRLKMKNRECGDSFRNRKRGRI
jgi:hypothetical protein